MLQPLAPSPRLRFRIGEKPLLPSVHTQKACSVWYFSTPAVPGFADHFQSVSATLLVGCFSTPPKRAL